MRLPTSSTRTLLAAFAVLGLASLSFAQPVSVKTNPVGAVTTTVPLGLSAIGYTLLNPDLVVASCSSNTASVITLTGVANVGSLLTDGLPYYVEATGGGVVEGERFEVDTAATKLAANNTIVLNVSSANNTSSLAINEAQNIQFALRKHVTLSQVQSMFASPLVAGSSAANSDQIRLYNTSTGAFSVYFLRSTGWFLGSTPSNNVAIPPGIGFFFLKRTAPGTLVATGGVRVNDFAMPMNAGLSLRSVGYPIPFSPAKLGATVANQWTGGSSSATADQLRVYNPTNGLFSISFMRTNSAWLQGSTAVTTTDILAPDAGYMLLRRNADTDYIIVAESVLPGI